jgi:hypothetical protein
MTTQYTYGRQRGSGGFFAFLLALVLGAVALGMFVRRAHTGAMGRIATLITGRSTSTVSAPVVVEKIQQLARLETVVYSLDTVVEGNKSSVVLPDLLAGDRLLLIVHGQTIAGVDLSKMKPDDVQIVESASGRAIHVVLPPSQVFTTAIDNQHTRVYARSTGLLVPADPNLETETRARAEQDLQKAALEDGILDAASKNARATVGALLNGLGFTQVDIK